RYGQQQGDQCPVPQRRAAVLGFFALLLGRGFRAGRGRGEADLFHLVDEVVERDLVRGVRDLGLLGREVDRGRHALHLVEAFFDPVRACSTGHTADEEFDLGQGVLDPTACTHCHPPRQCSLWLSALSWFCSTECFGASFGSTGPTKEPTPNIAANTTTSPIT